jgi:hypothetical protein
MEVFILLNRLQGLEEEGRRRGRRLFAEELYKQSWEKNLPRGRASSAILDCKTRPFI